MSGQWFVKRGDKARGPFTAARLKALADEGKLKPTDEVREAASDDWVRASTLGWLFPKEVAPEDKPAPRKPPTARSVAAPVPEEPTREDSASDETPKKRPAPSPGTPAEKAKALDRDNPQQALLIGGGILASVMLMGCCVCGGMLSPGSRGKTTNNAEAMQKGDSDPKSKKNAERKLEAFRAIVAHFKKMPDPLDGAAVGDKWDAKAEQLMNEFDAIPFDPVANRDIAKQIVRLCDKEIDGKYSGHRTNVLRTIVQNIAIHLVD